MDNIPYFFPNAPDDFHLPCIVAKKSDGSDYMKVDVLLFHYRISHGI